jgi:type I restriction enzyme, S subunit
MSRGTARGEGEVVWSMRTTIGKICTDISYGVTTSAAQNKSGPRLLRITDIKVDGVDWKIVPGCRISENEKRRALLFDGDVVIARTGGTVGKSFLVKNPPEAVYASYLIRLRTNTDIVLPEYLNLFLGSEHYWSQLRDAAQGAAQPNVNATTLSKISLSIPPIQKQRQIAARLKAQLAEVDKARQAGEAQLKGICFLGNRILQRLFAEFDSAPKKKLGDYAGTTSGSTPERGKKQYWQPAEIPWVKTGEVSFAPIVATDEAISQKALAECSLTLLPPKTVLIAMYGQGKTRGQSAILEIPAVTNQACFAVFPNDTWDQDFLFLWLKSSYQDLRDLSESRGGNQANLNGALLKALEVPAPSKSEQQQIVVRIKNALAEIQTMEKSSKAALNGINLLPQKILAQAFSLST